MSRSVLMFIALAVSMATAACGDSDEGAEDPVRDSVAPVAIRPVVEFDPSATHRGDMVVALTVDTIAARRATTGEYVGMARFDGTVRLTGRTFAHPDGGDYPFPCFEPDSATASRLPRWAGDTRRPWFCFENRDDAKVRFGSDSAGIRAEIRIDRFTIHRSLSDAVNSARLVEIVSLNDKPTLGATPCYTTDRSALGRAPGTPAPAPSNVRGWIRLDGLSRSGSDSGAARLVDSDRRSLAATWRRVGDSVIVVGQNDFMKVEIRVAASGDRLWGTGTIVSDAASSRGSAGGKPFERYWPLEATARPCEQMPVAQGADTDAR